jgi:hypothetical protein
MKDKAVDLGIVLDDATVKRLLGAGRRAEQQPAEKLVAALEDGTPFESLLASALDRPTAEVEQFFKNGGATFAELSAIKDTSHDAIAQCLPGLRLAWTAVYFATIASALVFHGALISKRPAATVVSTLLCLTEIDQAGWSSLFQDAAEAVS